MVHRSAADRQPQADVDRLVERDELGRNVTLIVILRDYEIEFAFERTIEHRVARDRPFDVDAFALRLFDRGCDVIDLLGAEDTALPAMRIKTCDRDAGTSEAQRFEVRIARTNGAQHTLGGAALRG